MLTTCVSCQQHLLKAHSSLPVPAGHARWRLVFRQSVPTTSPFLQDKLVNPGSRPGRCGLCTDMLIAHSGLVTKPQSLLCKRQRNLVYT